MKSLGLSRRALSSCATAALLAGCGGSQPPIGAPGALPQSRAIPPNRTIAHNIETGSPYRVLYSFGDGADGHRPDARLIDVNGTFYGTTYAGGTHNAGTVFSISTTGT